MSPSILIWYELKRPRRAYYAILTEMGFVYEKFTNLAEMTRPVAKFSPRSYNGQKGWVNRRLSFSYFGKWGCIIL